MPGNLSSLHYTKGQILVYKNSAIEIYLYGSFVVHTMDVLIGNASNVVLEIGSDGVLIWPLV